MTPVFISHAKADRKIADTICAALEGRGVTCWIAWRDVGPGENFGEVITRSIRHAKVMVLVFSESTNNSDEIKKEVVLAGRSRVPVIPLRVEDVEPSGAYEYELVTRQWIDLFAGWDHAIERLARQIEQIIGHAKSPPEPAPLPALPVVPDAETAAPLPAAVPGPESASPDSTGRSGGSQTESPWTAPENSAVHAPAAPAEDETATARKAAEDARKAEEARKRLQEKPAQRADQSEPIVDRSEQRSAEPNPAPEGLREAKTAASPVTAGGDGDATPPVSSRPASASPERGDASSRVSAENPSTAPIASDVDAPAVPVAGGGPVAKSRWRNRSGLLLALSAYAIGAILSSRLLLALSAVAIGAILLSRRLAEPSPLPTKPRWRSWLGLWLALLAVAIGAIFPSGPLLALPAVAIGAILLSRRPAGPPRLPTKPQWRSWPGLLLVISAIAIGAILLSRLPTPPNHASEAEDSDAAALNARGNTAYSQNNYAEALDLWRKAADQGYPAAQTGIGWLFRNGSGVPQDYGQAMTWYRKAADQGDAAAQNNIGELYHNGWGMPQDYGQAMIWYRKAADQGEATAQYNVGWLYGSGLGVKKNLREAHDWMGKSAAGGKDEAKKWLASH